MNKETFYIKGYKCFTDQKVKLGKLTVLVGANGNGKSSTIQSLLLFKLAASHHRVIDINRTFDLNLGRFSDIINLNTKGGEISFSLEDYREDSLVKATCSFKSDNRDESLYAIASYKSPINERLWNRKEVYYLSAERQGPRISQELVNLEYLNAGVHGEYVAQTIAARGWMVKVDESRMFANTRNKNLDAQVNYWLNFIFPNVSVTSAINTDILQARVKMSSSIYKDSFTTNMGFGVSYALPILVDGLVAKNNSLFIVENPEAHLHPSAQTAMGYFLAIIANSGVKVIVETHSDHLIDGVQLFVVQHKQFHDEVIINNYSIEEGNSQPNIEPITMNENGEYDKWPKGFMDQSQINYSEILKYRNNDTE